ncbi:MAG: DMT family transporter [Actinobacteria bacterium]|nr:DMT family transporter [Actinomycetota bacterium]
MIDKKNGVRIEYFLMLIVSFFWAIGHPLGRIILQKVHPLQLGAMTLGTGFIGLLIFLIISGRVKKIFELSRRDTLISLGLGVFGFFLYQILTFSALARIPASMNAVLVSNNVVFIVLLAALTLKERVKPLSIIGIILAICGVVLVTFNKGFSIGDGAGGIDLLGCAFSLLAALSTALYSVIGKRVLESNDPLIVAALAMFSGAVLLTILTAVTVGFSDVLLAGWPTILLMVFLGLTMISIAYPLWFVCLKKFPASQISIYIYLTPVFAVILSLIILHERFSWLFWVGGALILGGIIIANKFASGSSTPKNRRK